MRTLTSLLKVTHMSADTWEEDDWVNEDAECYYGADFCIDPFCRDVESCVSCELMIGPKEEGDDHEHR